MTPAEQSIAFLRVVRAGRHTLPQIAEQAGLTLDQAREVLFRGVQARRLKVDDKDRQNVVIEEVVRESAQ